MKGSHFAFQCYPFSTLDLLATERVVFFLLFFSHLNVNK